MPIPHAHTPAHTLSDHQEHTPKSTSVGGCEARWGLWGSAAPPGAKHEGVLGEAQPPEVYVVSLAFGQTDFSYHPRQMLPPF